MDKPRFNNTTKMGNSRSRFRFQLNRACRKFWLRRCEHNKSATNNRNIYRTGYIVQLALFCFNPVFANTTISNPQSSSSNTIVNQGFQQISGSFPTHRFSNGIQCQLPTLSFNPFVTMGEFYNTPKSTVTRTNIYDTAKDSETGELLNAGKILYVAEQPRLDQTNVNLSYGMTINLQIPLGKRFNDECLLAAETYRKYQQFLLQAKKLEVNLNRLRVCKEMLLSGAKFVGDDAVSCKNIVLTVKPDQILPHTHEIKKPPNNPEKGG